MAAVGGEPPILVFDCDGVLLVSNRMKAGVFGEAAAAAGFHADDVRAFQRHVLANFGTSRARLFEHLLGRADLQHRPATDVARLVALYADRLHGRYLKCPTTPAMRSCLRFAQERGIPIYVVSGSAEDELRTLMVTRGYAGFFREIYGSPVGKVEHLERIIADLGIAREQRERLLFVGDAEADWKAARATGVSFLYMSQFSTAKPRMRALQRSDGFATIRNLKELPPLLAARAGQ